MSEENETNSSSNESSLCPSDLIQETNDSDSDLCTIKRKLIDSNVSFASNSFDDDADSLLEENLTNNIITSYKILLMQIADTYSTKKTECLEIQSFDKKQLSEFDKDVCLERLLIRCRRKREKEKLKIIETINRMATIDDESKAELIYKITEKKYS